MRPPRLARAPIAVTRRADRIEIDAPKYHATVLSQGYVSGVAAGSFLDKATGSRDLGFGLDIVDFLLEPVDPTEPIPKDQYTFGPAEKNHGKIAKRYVEGPQICTQAKKLSPTIHQGADFVAITQQYTWNVPYAPRKAAGSVWEQTLIFPEGERFFLAADRVTVANPSSELILRVDLPGHVKHQEGAGFDHIYLSYNDPQILPSTEFVGDFPPDARFLYQRGKTQKPERFIRAYQVDPGPGKGEGPWLAGMTLNTEDVYQAWCHERGYVCLIEEIGGRDVKAGDVFGAAYILGWFDDLKGMNSAYDRFRGLSGFALDGPSEKPTGFRGLKSGELTPTKPAA
ncbi:MAG: hypothetical protein JWN86_2109 [Planctomycetota bacterium]|nr:hypothetical protein [Planctomycetota bacterium]